MNTVTAHTAKRQSAQELKASRTGGG